MAREREEVQADFLNSLLVDNDIHPYEFYAALARLDDHPMLEHMNPHLVEPRDGPDTGMSELPRSYLGISGDYVGIGDYVGDKNFFCFNGNKGAKKLFDKLATGDIQFTDGASWKRHGGNNTWYVVSEIVISDVRVPVYVRVRAVKQSYPM